MRLSATLIFSILASQAGGQTPAPVYQSIVITATPVEPQLERRNSEVFRQTLFSRDDQIFHLLDAGISAGQHEGGGKSVEIRRFGYNLDHGGVNGGLKVLVDSIPQNYSTQGHGQGYLGGLKSLSPELIGEVNIHNGPFRAEYGDFSGLGVVHILMRESLPEEYTVRMQGGNFGSRRGFLGWSPNWKRTDMVAAYDGSQSDGPFIKPMGYRRDNATVNLTRRSMVRRSYGLRFNGGRNDFSSSGQLPMDEVLSGRLSRFAWLDGGDGGRIRSAALGGYLRHETATGATWRLDGFAARSLFDLYSNFTFLLNDPDNGDGIQQHDSRLQQGANLQYVRPHQYGWGRGELSAGGNFHGNQNLVTLYSRVLRTPTSTITKAHARVTNGAGYVQENFRFFDGRLQAGGGMRYDVFRFHVRDRIGEDLTGASTSASFQPKANVAMAPSLRIPLVLHVNYGRGISSLDARGVVTAPGARHLATTDFLQAGLSYTFSRVSVVGDAFLIHRSNELVYIPDDGTLELLGPTRASGFEGKMSVALTSRLSLDGGLTRVMNAYYRNTSPREYVDRAPHFTANAALTLSYWKGFTGSMRMRAINSYRLDPLDVSNRAAGHTVFDLSMSRRLRRGVELQLAIDNMLDRSYWETQNYFQSRLAGQQELYRIHATPGFPLQYTMGLVFRFRGK
jgi:hypothetical protein